jgi:hypothetical protein
MTLPMCVRVHIPSVHPAEKFNHSTQGANSFSQMGVWWMEQQGVLVWWWNRPLLISWTTTIQFLLLS